MIETLNALRQTQFCAHLDQAALLALAQIAAKVEHPPGTIIQLEGDPGEAMYLVVSGQVKLARIGANGREQVIDLAGPGQHFNTVVVFDGGPCPANAEAVGVTHLLRFPSILLLQVIEIHPAIALGLLRDFAGRLRHMVNLIDSLALHTVQGRLAELLLAQAEAAARGESVAPLTQAEIAARLGTVREMVGRTLKSFEIQGLIRIERGVIVVVDRMGLEEQAER